MDLTNYLYSFMVAISDFFLIQWVYAFSHLLSALFVHALLISSPVCGCMYVDNK